MKTIKGLLQLALIVFAASSGATAGDENKRKQVNLAEVRESATNKLTAFVDENCNLRLPLSSGISNSLLNEPLTLKTISYENK